MKARTRILIAAGHRTGSTAVYNLTRTICAQFGPVYGCFEDQYDAEKGDWELFQVVKAHKFNQKWVDWAEVIITVFREPQEVKKSMVRFGELTGNYYDTEDIWRGLSWLAHYNLHADYMINFEQIERCPEKIGPRS